MTRPIWNNIELPGFLVTNETDIEPFIHDLRHRQKAQDNTIDVYVATSHALRFAVESASQEFYLADIDALVIDFHKLWRDLCMAVEGDLAQAEQILSGGIHNLTDALAPDNSIQERAIRLAHPDNRYGIYGFHIASPIDTVGIQGLWQHLKNSPHSIFNDEDAYSRLFDLYARNKIHLVHGGVDDSLIRRSMTDGKVLSTLYLSNIEYYVLRSDDVGVFARFVDLCHQNSVHDAKVYRTISFNQEVDGIERKGFFPDIETLQSYATRLIKIDDKPDVDDAERLRLIQRIAEKDRVADPSNAALTLLVTGTHDREKYLRELYISQLVRNENGS
jgi:hypothetical protein